MTTKQEATMQVVNSACNCTGACRLTGVCPANPLQGLSTFNQEWHNWEQLENARAIIEKQARRIAELEAALEVALEALENSRGLEPVDVQWVKGRREAAIAKLKEVRN